MTEAVNIVLKAVPGKTTMPILECVVIEAAGDQIKLTTNDMQLGIETRFPAQIEEDGIILVNAKMISDIIRKLPENDVYFEADDNENILLFCGKAKSANRPMGQIPPHECFTTPWESRFCLLSTG